MAENDHRDDFGFDQSWSGSDPGAPAAGIQIGTPQVVWLVLAAAVSLVALALAGLLGGMILPAAAGWLLSGPVAIGLLAVFVHTETRRRAMPTYADPGWLKAFYVGCVVLALAAVLASALRIALWAGRL